MGYNLKMYLVCQDLKTHSLEAHMKRKAGQRAAGIRGCWEWSVCLRVRDLEEQPAALQRTHAPGLNS